MEILVGLILIAAAYIGGSNVGKEEVKQAPSVAVSEFEQCAIACEGNMKFIKSRFKHCECYEGE